MVFLIFAREIEKYGPLNSRSVNFSLYTFSAREYFCNIFLQDHWYGMW
jgi:hypothetical protein